MSNLRITEFELVDHGIDSPSYFQGCGTTFTSYDHVVTGTGDNPREALDDLVEMAAQYAIPVDGVPRIIERDGQEYVNPEAWDDIDVTDLYSRIGKKDFPEVPSAWQKMLEANGLEDAEDEEEPDRDDFDTDEEYEEALDEYETRQEEYNNLNDCESNQYYMSLRFNVGPKDENEGDNA